MTPIMTHYRHLLKWIESSNQLQFLNECEKGIDSFAHTHRKFVAIAVLESDLRHLCSTKRGEIAKIELTNLSESKYEG